MSAHYVYRCFGEDGRLLYVGCTQNLTSRLRGHDRSSFWAPWVVKVRAEVHPSKFTARRIEREAIHAERPRFNVLGRGSHWTKFTEAEWSDYLLALEAAARNSGSDRALRNARALHEGMQRIHAAEGTA